MGTLTDLSKTDPAFQFSVACTLARKNFKERFRHEARAGDMVFLDEETGFSIFGDCSTEEPGLEDKTFDIALFFAGGTGSFKIVSRAAKTGGTKATLKSIAKEVTDEIVTEVIGVNPFKSKFWKAKSYKDIKVYQRNDLMDPKRVDKFGRTNIERMKLGLAPLGPDGKPINLHHMLQTQGGPVAEVTQTFHQKNTKVLHINPKTIPSGIDREEFDLWKSEYWKDRVKDFEN